FKQKPEKLEWVIAAIVAWQPIGLRDLHRRIKKVDPAFLDFDPFERNHADAFLFDPSSAAGLSTPRSPDWTVLWEYESQTGYGWAYPADVRAFLTSFLADVKLRDPGALILDIGTGKHAATLIAREMSPHFDLYGIDVARLPPPPKEAQIRAARMSANQLAFADLQFAAVMSVNGIEYADSERAFPEMHRVMRAGAAGALVLHRPDSSIAASSKNFLGFVESVPLMETLALAERYLHKGTDLVRRELARRVAELRRIEVKHDFGRYYRAVITGIPNAIRLRGSSPERGHHMIRRFEKDLRWRYQRDQFVVSHMSRVPTNREDLGKWLCGYGFEVDVIGEVFDDYARGRTLLGWAVRFHKPKYKPAN
ncbi:MAG: class I SAM-dependent methyltransferase, partial [Gammaproteobacteria bacterium]